MNIVEKILALVNTLGPLLPLIGRLVPGLDEKIEQIKEGIQREGAEFIQRNPELFATLAQAGDIISDIGIRVRMVGVTFPRFAADGKLDGGEYEQMLRMIALGKESAAKALALPGMVSSVPVH